MKAKLNVAVVGATGAVGRELLSIMDQRKFPVGELRLFASARSLGVELEFRGAKTACRVLEPGCFTGIDLAFFDASDAVSREWVPVAVREGAWVVDNSAVYRMDAAVPLVVPEVNGEKLDEARGRIVAGPNCSTVQLVMALKPLRDRFGLTRVIVSTYQSVSGAGSAARTELEQETRRDLAGGSPEKRIFPHPIAFNCIPQIGSFGEDGYTGEEKKIVAETRRLLSMPKLAVTATAVRVPVFSCHAESAYVECERPVDIKAAREALSAQPGVILRDDPGAGEYPLGRDATGKDAVYVGRVRKDLNTEKGLNLWIVSDNLRKGAALNAIQIGELLAGRLA